MTENSHRGHRSPNRHGQMMAARGRKGPKSDRGCDLATTREKPHSGMNQTSACGEWRHTVGDRKSVESMRGKAHDGVVDRVGTQGGGGELEPHPELT